MVPTRHVHRSTTRSRPRRSEHFKHGDLVLVKVFDYPAWPAKISKPQDFKRTPDRFRYFVQLFGINEQAFVAPSDIQLFTGEMRIRAHGKSNVARDFAKAVKEINESFERKRKSLLKDDQTKRKSLLKDDQSSARLENKKEAAQEGKMSAFSESKVEDSTPSIRNLIELAKEKSKGARSQSLQQDVSRRTPIIGSVQPRADLSTGGSLSTDADAARDAFKGIIEILSKAKESIHGATRLAFDCAKNGIASEVIELIIEKLENEHCMHGRVKLFFLVDSIIKHSMRQKDIVGAYFIAIVQYQLPRLLGAAAPFWVGPRENHRQCAKILQLWIKMKIIPKSKLQPYIDNIELFIRNSSLADRALNDRTREIDGMLIDEYGSNTMLQLPRHLFSQVFVEEDETPDISCHQELEMEHVPLHLKDKKEVSAEGNGLDGRDRNSPPSPPESPPLPPPLPPSPMPPLPPNSPSPTPPPPPLPSHDPIQSSHIQRPPPAILAGPWGQPMMRYGQPPTFYYSWRPA